MVVFSSKQPFVQFSQKKVVFYKKRRGNEDVSYLKKFYFSKKPKANFNTKSVNFGLKKRA
jgi:hypothetical protein